MRTLVLLTLVCFFVTFSAASAFPMLFDVWGTSGSDNYLGTISAYSGALDAASNYDYYSASGHPVNGPTPAGYQAFVWMHWDTSAPTGQHLSFNLIHDVDGGGSPDNIVSWDLNFVNTSYNVLLQDDSGEGSGGFSDQGGGLMWADFQYWYNTDCGVIGVDEPFCGSGWEINLAFNFLSDIGMVKAASGDDNHVMMWSPNQMYDSYKLTPHCIPEPGTLILLGSGLLPKAGLLRRRER